MLNIEYIPLHTHTHTYIYMQTSLMQVLQLQSLQTQARTLPGPGPDAPKFETAQTAGACASPLAAPRRVLAC